MSEGRGTPDWEACRRFRTWTRRSAASKRKHAEGKFSYAHLRRGVHPRERPVLAPDGRTWPSVSIAAAELGVAVAMLSRRCRKGTFGWRYLEVP